MKKAVIILAIVASLTACNKTKIAEANAEVPKTTEATTESHEHKAGEAHDEKVAYACPMDCENGKTYDKPGKCPKCEMDLEKK